MIYQTLLGEYNTEINPNEILNNLICTNCYCANSEHEKGKCYGMKFNGTVWSTCWCKQLVHDIKIKFQVPDYEFNISHREIEPTIAEFQFVVEKSGLVFKKG